MFRFAPLPTCAVLLCGLLSGFSSAETVEGKTARDAATDNSESQNSKLVFEREQVMSVARELALSQAYDRGIEWLLKGQAGNLDGSMAVGARDGQPVPIAVTALGVLALMAGGNTYGRGPHGAQVARAIDYLLAHTNLDQGHEAFGFIGREGAPEAIRMHSHGFATLALAQAFSTSHRSNNGKQLKLALEAAIHRIEKSQGREGGWFYNPVRNTNHEGSVTICLVQALRAARDAGIHVDPDVVKRAEEYVVKSQKDNGLFAYQIYDPDSETTVALTAAGISTLYSLGEYAGQVVDRGMTAIWRELELRERGKGKEPNFPYYERLYLAQAMWQHSELEHFRRWSSTEFKRILADQASDGHWSNRRYGDSYATAVNCLVLSMSQELLPIFQR
ncbi:MAG: hypothetical protein ACI8TQ_002066 [Planctomycetota bacterium]|jgi:hypothetical protein